MALSLSSLQYQLSPTTSPRQWPVRGVIHFFASYMRLRTIAAIAALLQTLLLLVLPTSLAIVPVCVLLLTSAISTIQQLLTYHSRPNRFTQDVVPGRSTIHFPFLSNSNGSDERHAGQQVQTPSSPRRRDTAGSIVCFQIGFQINHPLGPFSPYAAEVGAQFRAMVSQLLERREELGVLDVSSWTAGEMATHNTLQTTIFFRDIESIHRFAHEELHRTAWAAFVKRDPSHLGVFHETYFMHREDCEALYLNCRPLMLGRTQVKVHAGQASSEKTSRQGGSVGKGLWMNSLVNADHPELRTYQKRLQLSQDV